MDAFNIFDELKRLDFSPDKYVVIGGAAMAARGIKETRDIDVLVFEDLLEAMKKQPGWHYHPRIMQTEPAGLVNDNGSIELYPTVGGTTIGFKEIRKDAEMIDDIPFASLEHVMMIKKIYKREKDLKDIELIEKYLTK
jgi:hypothetical protein